MQSLLITFAALAILRYVFVRHFFQGPNARFGMAVQNELAAWLLTAAILAGAFLVILMLTLFFGPIPQIHEWGRD